MQAIDMLPFVVIALSSMAVACIASTIYILYTLYQEAADRRDYRIKEEANNIIKSSFELKEGSND